MPEIPIVDSHLHLWDPARFRMPWLDGDELLDKPYALPEYREHTAGIEIAAMVYLQVDVSPPYGLLEARWAVERAAEDRRIQAIVPYAPIEDGACVRSFLDELVRVSPLIKGVRRLIQGEADPEFCTRPGFVRGVQLLGEYGLSFDICIRHPQLPAAIALARQCPDTQLILDHIGKPDIAREDFSPWRERIMELAALPNVHCKLSGLVTEADRAHWRIDDLRPFAAHILATFGQNRVLFGGDWPVVLGASSYRRWVETVEQLIADQPQAARENIWAGNARRFYRLAN